MAAGYPTRAARETFRFDACRGHMTEVTSPPVSGRGHPATSLDVRCAHPGLCSLRVRGAPASCLRLLPQPGSHGWGDPSLRCLSVPNAAGEIQVRSVFVGPLQRESIPSPFQEAPGGNPGTPGAKTTPQTMPHASAGFPPCEPAAHGAREGLPPGVPRLPPGAFCGSARPGGPGCGTDR